MPFRRMRANGVARIAPLGRGTLGPTIALFVLLALLYSFSVGLRASRGASITGDEPFYLLTTQSILQDGDLDLRQQYARQSYRSFFDHPRGLWSQSAPLADGRLVSPHNPGLSVLLLPGFALDGLRGAQVQLQLMAAATFSLAFVLTALETGRRWLSWAVTVVVALTAPAFVYATEVYPELPGAFCLILALLVLRQGGGIRRAVALVLLLSALTWLGVKYTPLGGLVALVYLWRAAPRERWCFLLLGAASAVLYAAVHLAVFGALTPYSASTVYDGSSTAAVLESHIALRERIYRLWGLFIDRRFGIGRWAPIMLAVCPALPMLIRSGLGIRERNGPLIAGLIGGQLLIATFVSITMMGWWFPGRMLMVVYPLFAVALTVALLRLPRAARVIGAVAGGYSLVVTALLVSAVGRGEVTIAVDPFAMTHPLFAALGPLFPQYTGWGRNTVVLNTLWLTLGVGAVIGTTWQAWFPRDGSSTGSRWRWRASERDRQPAGAARRESTATRGGSTR